MMIRALCDGLASKQVKIKMIDLPSVPRVGDRLMIEAEAGEVALHVKHVSWREGKPVTLILLPGPLGQIFLGDVVLDQDGWKPA